MSHAQTSGMWQDMLSSSQRYIVERAATGRRETFADCDQMKSYWKELQKIL